MHNLSDKFFSLKVYEEMGRKRQNLLLWRGTAHKYITL
jgi:hypothetical protein